MPVLTGGTTFGGAPDEGVAFMIDLTERKRAELALRESEREARLIVETIPGMVASLTPAGEVEFVNKELVEYCGQGLDDMKQWGTNGTVHADDLPHVVDLFARGITSGEPYDFDMRVRRFDGVYRWFQVRGFPLRDMGGQVVRWYSLLSDIDDRKRAEAELSALKDQLYKENLVLRDEVDRTSMFEEIVGDITGAAAGAGPRSQGRAHRLHRADHRGDRHRQGARRARDPSAIGARLPRLRQRQLRRDSP